MRVPSLRELRRRRPANVVILPTAADRQVQQRYGRDFITAKRALIDSQGVEFPHQLPAWRQIEREAESLDLRADVPPFDPGNPAHVRAWESLWSLGRMPWPSGRE